MFSFRIACSLLLVSLFLWSVRADDEDHVIDLQELLQNVEAALNKHENASLSSTAIPYRDCADVYLSGKTSSGVYLIRPTGWETIGSFEVFCDMDTEEGGWTVFQRRGDFDFPQDYFYRNWKDYRNCFGDLRKEFWLGNDRLSALTNQGDYTLRVDLKDMDGNTKYAQYKKFKVGDASEQFKLECQGYSGTAGDSLISHHNMLFSTKDRNNDIREELSCAEDYKGAWWYWGCHHSNLNGLNLKGDHESYGNGINWLTWKDYNYSLFSEMKIRPGIFA